MTTLADKAETASAALSNDEVLRYSRHLIMPEVGMEGQLKLKQAKVLCLSLIHIYASWSDSDTVQDCVSSVAICVASQCSFHFTKASW